MRATSTLQYISVTVPCDSKCLGVLVGPFERHAPHSQNCIEDQQVSSPDNTTGYIISGVHEGEMSSGWGWTMFLFYLCTRFSACATGVRCSVRDDRE